MLLVLMLLLYPVYSLSISFVFDWRASPACRWVLPRVATEGSAGWFVLRPALLLYRTHSADFGFGALNTRICNASQRICWRRLVVRCFVICPPNPKSETVKYVRVERDCVCSLGAVVHEEPDVITVAANVNAIAKVSYVFQYFVYHKPLFVARLLKSDSRRLHEQPVRGSRPD